MAKKYANSSRILAKKLLAALSDYSGEMVGRKKIGEKLNIVLTRNLVVVDSLALSGRWVDHPKSGDSV